MSLPRPGSLGVRTPCAHVASRLGHPYMSPCWGSQQPSPGGGPGKMWSLISGVFWSGRRRVAVAAGGPEAAAATPAPSPAELQRRSREQKRHVVFLVHGLFGSAANWRVISRFLAQQLDPATTLLHVSTANEFAKTFEGVDICGERLADEVRAVAAAHPNLERVSFVGHSMGGLISRYAAGRLFDPRSRTICGLQPCHLVCMVTPHLGCDGELNPAQVPLLNWAGAVPAIGGGVQRALQGVAVPFAHLAFRRAGLQFFLMDREGGGREEPLLVRMTRDHPVEGYFLSALEAFETRTLYANSSGDHLVGWGNSSLRAMHELPKLGGKGKGVVREDPLEAAWHPAARARLRRTPSVVRLHASEGHQVTAGDILRSRSPEQLAESGQHTGEVPSPGPPVRGSSSPSDGAPSSRDSDKGDGDASPCASQQQQQEEGGAAGQPHGRLRGGFDDSGGSGQPPSGLPLLVPPDALWQPQEEQQQAAGPMGPASAAAAAAVAATAAEGSPGPNSSLAERSAAEEQQTQHQEEAQPSSAQPLASAPHHSKLGQALKRVVTCSSAQPMDGEGGVEEVSPGPTSPQQTHPAPASPSSQPAAAAAVAGAATAVGAAVVGERLGPALGEGARAAAATATAGRKGGSKRAGGSDPGGPAEALRPGSPRKPWHVPQGANSLDQALAGERGEYVALILRRLQQLPWRRVDVCFGRSLLPFLSHQHIQVQRWWVNWEGIATAKHLALQLAAMEELRSRGGSSDSSGGRGGRAES